MGFVPELASQIVSNVIQVVAGTARELQSRHRRNTFLDRVNQDLFMPRGMYAMVMAFQDKVPGQQPRGPLSKLAGSMQQSLFSSERLDINATVAKYSSENAEMSRLKKGLKDLRLVSGKTHGEIELPEAAALIYPDLDRLIKDELQIQGKGRSKESESSVKEKLKGAGAWVQDYMDRKAQATYVSLTPRIVLNFSFDSLTLLFFVSCFFCLQSLTIPSGTRPSGLITSCPLGCTEGILVTFQ